MRPEPREDAAEEPLWVSQIVRTHAELGSRICTIARTAVFLSAILMAMMLLHLRRSGDRYLSLSGALAGLFLGVFCAWIIWGFLRPGSEEDVAVPGLSVTYVWWSRVFKGPVWLVNDILHWRRMNHDLEGNRAYPTVESYLAGDLPFVRTHAIVALAFYLGVPVVLVLAM